jgi:hypothetical protein
MLPTNGARPPSAQTPAARHAPSSKEPSAPCRSTQSRPASSVAPRQIQCGQVAAPQIGVGREIPSLPSASFRYLVALACPYPRVPKCAPIHTEPFSSRSSLRSHCPTRPTRVGRPPSGDMRPAEARRGGRGLAGATNRSTSVTSAPAQEQSRRSGGLHCAPRAAHRRRMLGTRRRPHQTTASRPKTQPTSHAPRERRLG